MDLHGVRCCRRAAAGEIAQVRTGRNVGASSSIPSISLASVSSAAFTVGMATGCGGGIEIREADIGIGRKEVK